MTVPALSEVSLWYGYVTKTYFGMQTIYSPLKTTVNGIKHVPSVPRRRFNLKHFQTSR